MWLSFGVLNMLPTVHAQEGIRIERAELEYSDSKYRLSLSLDLVLTPALHDALSRGVPLYFSTEVQVTRPRWYWFDEKAVNTSVTTRLSLNVLTQQYQVSINGIAIASFRQIEDALATIRRPPNASIAQRESFTSGEVYEIALRSGLDVARLPKPIQVHALNSSDWRFVSDWKRFTFRAE